MTSMAVIGVSLFAAAIICVVIAATIYAFFHRE